MVFAVDDHVHNGCGLRGWREQDSIDDVHHTVIGGDVGHRDGRIVDHHCTVHDGDGNVFTEQSGEHVAIHEVGAERSGTHDVIEEDVSQTFECEEVIGSDTELGHQGYNRVVGWCKDGKRTFSGQGVYQASSTYGRFQQRVVFAVDDHVHNGCSLRSWREQDSIDHVHHTIVGSDVGHSDGGVIDHHCAVHDGDGDVFTEQGGEHVAVHEVGAECRGPHNVVEEDIRKAIKGEEVFGSDAEFSDQSSDCSIGRCEDRKWAVAGQVVGEFSRDDGRLEKSVVFAVHYHVDYCSLG